MYVLVRHVDTGADEERLSQKSIIRVCIVRPFGLAGGPDVRPGFFVETRLRRSFGPGVSTYRISLKSPLEMGFRGVFFSKGQPQDVCGPQTDYGFSMFRKIIMHQLERGHVIGQS